MEPSLADGLGWRPYRRIVLLWVREVAQDEEVAENGVAVLHAYAGDFVAIDDQGYEHVISPGTLASLEPLYADDGAMDQALDLWGRLDLSKA